MPNNGCKLGTTIALNLWLLAGLAAPTLALECLSPSYTVRQGKNYLDDVTPRELLPGEYEMLKQLFMWMDGDWAGDGHTVRCAGPEDGIRKETESYTIASRGRNRSHGRFTLESHIDNPEQRTKADRTYDLYLNEQRLASSDVSVSDIEIVNASAAELVFVKKARIKGAGLFTAHEWIVGLRKVSETSLEAQEIFYVNGRLISTSLWRLERN